MQHGILRHGRIIVAEVRDDVRLLLFHQRPEVADAERLRDGAALSPHVHDDVVAVGVGERLLDLQAHDGAHAVVAAVGDDFFPDVRAHVFVKARVAAARAEARLERLAGGVGLRVVAHGAEVHLDALFRLAHAHAGAGQLRADQAAAVEDAVGVHELREHLVIAKTVLQRHDRRLRSDAGHGVGHDVLRLRGLDHEDDHIHRADVARGRARVKAREHLLALRRAEDQPVGCDLVHVRLVLVDEPELGAALAQIGGKDAAGSAGADHCDFHAVASLANCRPVVARPAAKKTG